MALALVEEEDGGVMPTRYFSRAAQAALLEGASRTHTRDSSSRDDARKSCEIPPKLCFLDDSKWSISVEEERILKLNLLVFATAVVKSQLLKKEKKKIRFSARLISHVYSLLSRCNNPLISSISNHRTLRIQNLNLDAKIWRRWNHFWKIPSFVFLQWA